MISFQKQLIIQQALNDDYSTCAPGFVSENGQNFAASERSAHIANIKLKDNTNSYEDTKSQVQRGGGVVSLANSANDSKSMSGVISAQDEQGIRTFLFKLLNARHIFTTVDIVDQIEAFIQIKLDKSNQMIASFRDRLAKQEKETRRLLLENKKMSQDQFSIGKVFKECMD